MSPATIQQSPFPENQHSHGDGSASIHFALLGGGLMSFCANVAHGETASALLARLAGAARARGAHAIQGTVFCDPTDAEAKKISGGGSGSGGAGGDLGAGADGGGGDVVDFPVACLGRHDTPRGHVLGARITALPAGTFERVKDERGANCGARWETDSARYLLLGALVPRDTGAARDEQAAALWRSLKARIENAGFTIGDLVRTWFYNDHILDWYAEFNRVRNAFFTENNIFGTLVPASTGIGASNAAGAALTVDALAIAPKMAAAAGAAQARVLSAGGGTQDSGGGTQDSGGGTQDSGLRTQDAEGGMRDGFGVSIAAVTSPLQCPAYDYKSAFSRAVECAEPGAGGLRLLTISGTASIAPGGLTAHVGDVDAQIDLTLRVVAAILESRGMSWRDTARAILYFPKIEWMPRWHARRVALGLPELPAVFAHTDICRDDLLFEIELDATTRLRREIPNPKIPNPKIPNPK